MIYLFELRKGIMFTLQDWTLSFISPYSRTVYLLIYVATYYEEIGEYIKIDRLHRI
jgi:hypothetical protein